jgi:nitrite reductase/ring-hydroxylating ferredoxin subunit/uncharacterized membrane protein
MMASETIINAIAQQDWLEDVADPLQKLVRETLPRELKNALHGTWFGHPLHPALVAIPLGAWTAALVLDALHLDDAADTAVGIGLLGAVGSAVTGITDWSETDDRAKKIGVMHAALNIVSTSLYAASFLMRRGKQRQAGVSLSMIGYAISGAAGYLGGHLVFGEQIGVDHSATADSRKPEKVTAVMAASSLREDKPTPGDADGVDVALVKRGDRVYCLGSTCPHLGGPLAEGKLVGDAIQCPWHQSEFALEDGHVVNGPATFPARCFDVRTRSGQIEVRAANKQAAD